MEFEALSTGSLVYVTSYGPYWGLRGTILAVDAVVLTDQDSLYFYLVVFHEGPTREPLWLVHDDVARVDAG